MSVTSGEAPARHTVADRRLADQSAETVTTRLVEQHAAATGADHNGNRAGRAGRARAS